MRIAIYTQYHKHLYVMDLKGVIRTNTDVPPFHSLYVISFKMADYPRRWVMTNKGIILNYKNDLICLGLLDIFRIGYFGLEFDLADQTCKSSCAYVFSMESLSSASSYVLYESRSTLFVPDGHQT